MLFFHRNTWITLAPFSPKTPVSESECQTRFELLPFATLPKFMLHPQLTTLPNHAIHGVAKGAGLVDAWDPWLVTCPFLFASRDAIPLHEHNQPILVCVSRLPRRITACWYYLSLHCLKGWRYCRTFCFALPSPRGFLVHWIWDSARGMLRPENYRPELELSYPRAGTSLAAIWLSHLILGNNKWVRGACILPLIMLITLSDSSLPILPHNSSYAGIFHITPRLPRRNFCCNDHHMARARRKGCPVWRDCVLRYAPLCCSSLLQLVRNATLLQRLTSFAMMEFALHALQ